MFKALLLAALTGIASPAMAQSVWSVEGVAGVVSDYRYRGYSLSDQQPAIQAGATLSHQSGLYGDVYLSTIDEYGVDAKGHGAQVELTASFGWSGAVGGLDVDAAISRYVYPEGEDVDYFEAPLQVGQTLGDLTWTLGLAYAPTQTALGDDDNRYGWAGLTLAPAQWPVSLSTRLGYERGAFAPDGKTDWSVGVARTFGPATLDLTWADSGAEAGTLVASVFFAF